MTTDHSVFETGLDRDNRIVFLCGEITEETVAKTIMGLAVLKTDNPNASIKLIINSSGGDYYHGIGIYDYIRSLGCYVYGYVYGSCMSTASIILQACTVRYISKHSTLMIHNGSDGGVEMSVVDYEKWADHAKIHRNFMYEIYASRSDKVVSYWQKRCANDYILTADKALSEGLVDKII